MLEEFFTPSSVAVIGASREPDKVGHAVLRNIIEGGFTGTIHAVNPKGGDILGVPTYATVSDVPGTLDLAVVVVPARFVSGVIRECGERGTKAAIVISAGFRESGPDGAALERELLATAREFGVRIIGPNCLGVISTAGRLNASFAQIMPAVGGIAFLSQSGALGTAILDWAAGEGIGLAHFVSLGNKADISEVDLLRTWADDPATEVAVAYLESIRDGRAFVDAVTDLVERKPFIGLTAGTSDAGARAVSSHTGSLAGSKVAYGAAFRKAGAVAAGGIQELFDFAEGFARQPVPAGSGLAILTNAGGPAILATDACEHFGVRLASLDPATTAALREILPPAASVYNPVDILGDADATRYERALRVLQSDPGVHSILCITTPQAVTKPRAIADAIVRCTRGTELTTLAVFMGDATMTEAVGVLRGGGVPEYAFPERAVATLGAMEEQGRRLRAEREEKPAIGADRGVVRSAIDHARAAGRTFVTEESARKITAAYGIPVPKGGLADDLTSARELASEMGFPVVMKIASPDILHKTDIGGIALGLESVADVEQAYEDILGRVRRRMPEARIWGVTLHEQLPPGREVIIGINRDPSFGPLLMFGLGGVYVEVLKDVTFRLCPVTPKEAREMISDIRGYGLLRGARGDAPADIDAIADVIVRVSALAMDFGDIAELDINPLIVGERGQGAIAADVRIGIGG